MLALGAAPARHNLMTFSAEKLQLARSKILSKRAVVAGSLTGLRMINLTSADWVPCSGDTVPEIVFQLDSPAGISCDRKFAAVVPVQLGIEKYWMLDPAKTPLDPGVVVTWARKV